MPGPLRIALVLGVYVLSGAVSALAFPPFDMPWLIWVALAPAFVAAVSGRLGTALFGGFLFGLTQALLLLHWFFGIWGAAAIGLHIIYAAFFAVTFAFLQAVSGRFGKQALLWAAPLLWVGVEFFRSECWMLKFSWFGLGYSQHANVAFLQAAAVGGVYLLSLLIAAANGALAWVLENPDPRRLVPLLLVVIAVSGVHLAGGGLPEAMERDYGVLAVEGEGAAFDHFIRKTNHALRVMPETHLVVWPEYAIPGRPCDPFTEQVAALARARAVPVLFGGTRPAEGPPPNDFENTLHLVLPSGEVQRQAKSVPVPFFLDGQPARDRAPLKAGRATIGAAICYDMDFPYVSRELVREGAQILVFPTMDALSWGETQHIQHASLAPLRAVEHRRWLVRVGSSGISRVIDPYGRGLLDTEVGGPNVFHARVGLRFAETFYTLYGYYFPHLCLLATVVLVVLAAARRRRRPPVPAPAPEPDGEKG